jgi:homoserine kinase
LPLRQRLVTFPHRRASSCTPQRRGRPMQQVTVRVPASTSNLGPGFDCLGVSLRIYNDVVVTRGARSRSPAVVKEAADLFFHHIQRAPFSFSVSIMDKIPRSRGLGSSVTVRLGVLHALNALTGNRVDRLSIFQLCAQLEGHPDNAAPAIFGGFTVVRGQTIQRFDVSALLSFVLLIPDFEITTSRARRILPPQIKRAAAVKSCANACAITAAFASGSYRNLRGAFADNLHQPYRLKLIPFLPRVVAAAEKAGALGAFLSGSGSTICAITLQDGDRIATAMKGATGLTSSRMMITTADNKGARLLRPPITDH